MIINFQEDPTLQNKQYDYCICGAGAAGIALALDLSNHGKKVALFEGGGYDYTQQSQEIYIGKATGEPYWLDLLRLRFLGGTTNHWSGRCRPFTELDFSRKVINGLPGWPISYKEMNKYLPDAIKILGLNAQNTFNPLKNNDIKSLKFEPDIFASSEVRFRDVYSAELESSENIDLYINANLININLNKNLSSVKSIEVKGYNLKTIPVNANNYILAMGAIENARILLNSNQQIPGGIGNHSDMVGRCFMEHLNVRMGEFIANTSTWGDAKSMQFITKSDFSEKMEIGLSNITFGIVGDIKAYGRTAELKKIFNKLSCSFGLSDQLQFLYKHDCVGEGTISSLCEQFPNKNSRVSLTNDIDKLGLNRVELDWQISKADEKSIRISAIAIAEEFANNNFGRVKLSSFITNPNEPISVSHHSHQMGTTRMSELAKDGVVDVNCKVHGIANLYVAGASVFATGGAANPTMPLLQLTYRLSNHLIAKNS